LIKNCQTLNTSTEKELLTVEYNVWPVVYQKEGTIIFMIKNKQAFFF